MIVIDYQGKPVTADTPLEVFSRMTAEGKEIAGLWLMHPAQELMVVNLAVNIMLSGAAGKKFANEWQHKGYMRFAGREVRAAYDSPTNEIAFVSPEGTCLAKVMNLEVSAVLE